MKFYKLALAILSIVLVSCGGGDAEQCDAPKQLFSIAFPSANYSGKVGVAFSLMPSVNPETCRSKMTIQVAGGSMPPGLKISSGQISGTPTSSGTYTLWLGIVAVEGYEEFSEAPVSRSATITITK